MAQVKNTLEKLKKGERVTVAIARFANVRRTFGTVKRIYPSGLTVVEIGSFEYKFRRDGNEVSESSSVSRWLEV